jgi:hypothetical protein
VETFKQARERLLQEAREAGWTVKTHQSNGKALKEPWAETRGPKGDVRRLTFKTQAVYAGVYSACSDIRGVSLQEVIRLGFGS